MRTLSFASSPARAGSVLLGDTYLLGRLMGRGGTSELYEATHARLPGRFAVKVLAPKLVGNREAFARFCREAEVLSELRHPNLIQIFDFNTTPDERPYFVMEYLEGRDLQTRLEDSERLTLPATVRVVEAVASALAAAHAHGIVHRNLKPANIFLVAVDGQPDELVKVLDFGISKARSASTLPSAATEILGSPPYMSPEQVRGATGEIDWRTDQFALGAIAYRILTGHEPFAGPDISSVLDQIVHRPPMPLAHHLPVSWDTRPLQSVLDRAMSKAPAERWGGMMELARAFEAAAERTFSSAPSSSPARIALESPRAAPTPLAIVRPAPVPVPISQVRKHASPPRLALEPRHPIPERASDDLGGELDATFDRVPVTHHRAAALGTVVLMLAVLLIATRWYRKIPGTLPRLRQSLAAWLQPRPRVRTEPLAPPLAVNPVSAPPLAAPVVTAQSAPPAAAPPAAAVATPTSPPEAAIAEPVAVAVPPRHHHAASSRFRGHPGSIELAPPAADPSPAHMPEGFPIEPPASLADSPARDPIPTPPAEAQSPPSSPSNSGDAPLAPSLP